MPLYTLTGAGTPSPNHLLQKLSQPVIPNLLKTLYFVLYNIARRQAENVVNLSFLVGLTKLRIIFGNFQVISGHTGWVRSVAVEPGNKWFATGSADRTIKVNI